MDPDSAGDLESGLLRLAADLDAPIEPVSEALKARIRAAARRADGPHEAISNLARYLGVEPRDVRVYLQLRAFGTAAWNGSQEELRAVIRRVEDAMERSRGWPVAEELGLTGGMRSSDWEPLESGD